MINALTVDVEDYFHVAALAESVPRDRWDSMEYRAEASTRRLLQILAESGTKATFFVLGWVARRSPHLIKEIVAAGHEIASHGWSHKLVYNQTRSEFVQETRDAKALLEDITGHVIEGYRASTYSITSRSLWALDVLCELGFKYDSSIFPIRHDLYGIPGAPLRPAVIHAPEGGSILEFPMSVSRIAGVNVPVSGGGYFRLLPYWFTKYGLRRLNNTEGRPFAFYLHPWEIDTEQPVLKASAKSKFRHYTNLTKTEPRLRGLLRDFRFAPMREVFANLGLMPHRPV